MTAPGLSKWLTLEDRRRPAAWQLATLAEGLARAMARIARANHEYTEGRISLERLLEVIRQETSRV